MATGNAGSCTSPPPNWAQYTDAVVALSLNLQVLGAWQTANPLTTDLDFGATPTLFMENVGGQPTPMVGVANKNGYFYAFTRTNLQHSQGPTWKYPIAQGGSSPELGQGSISSAAWDSSPDGLGMLYAAGGTTTIKGSTCKGSLRALNLDYRVDPASFTLPDAAISWQVCFDDSGHLGQKGDGPVLGPVTAYQNTAVVGEGSWIVLVDRSSGVPQYTQDPYFTAGGQLVGGAAISYGTSSQGVLYIGDTVPVQGQPGVYTGDFYAFQ